MTFDTGEIFVWNNINFFKILSKPKSKHYYCNCKNKFLLRILIIFGYNINKLNNNDLIFSKKNNNFYESDSCIYKYSVDIYDRIFSLKNNLNISHDRYRGKIFKSYIAEDIKDNIVFYIKTKNFFFNKQKKKIIFFLIIVNFLMKLNTF